QQLGKVAIDVTSVETVRTPERPRPISELQPGTSTSVASSPTRPLSASLTLADRYAADLPTAVADRQRLLDELNDQVRSCMLCRELACSGKPTVFGVGSAKPRVVFFGEAPGADEDRQGEPFVGRAGQLLTKIIEACGWKRSDVYIMNVQPQASMIL